MTKATPAGLRPWFIRLIPLCLAALALALPACGGGKLNPVRGQVLHNGEPAAGAVVILHPTDPDAKPTDPRPTGVAGTDGKFELESIRTPGAPAGKYVVTITWPGEAAKGKLGMGGGDNEKAVANDRLKGRYADRSTSKIEVTIKPGSNTLEPFRLD